MALIEIEGLEVVFASHGDRVRAVDGIDLAVEARESFGLVGESGSGKSTVLRALCGLAPVTAGQARIAGLPPPRGHGGGRARAFARRVQMVFQDPFGSLSP
ncbi:MAG: ATP-binding cassette domain-containing protein, partial [Tistlia sp.]